MKKTIQNRVLPVVAMLAFLFTGFVSNRATAQTYICNGDSVCFDATGARGNIDWWVSTGGGAWSVVGSGDHFCTIPPVGDHMAVGSISEGTCDTIWTDTLHVIVNTAIDITTTSDTLLLADCNGSLSGIATLAGMVVSGGIMPYSYEWTPASGLSSTTVMDPDYTGPGSVGFFTYTITVTDSVGCKSTHDLVIHVDPQGTTTFNFTGGIQTFTVPACVDTVFLQVWGAQGGSGAAGGGAPTPAGGTGGLGGYAEGWLLVAPGDVFNVFVGGQGATPTGGFNGGANGGSTNAGGGGGASDIRVGGTAEANRVITAGGGGGGGRGGCEGSSGAPGAGGSGGSGGSSAVAGNGADSPTSGGVAGGGQGGNFGAVQGASGPAGAGCGGFLGSPGGTASTGTGATGGAGQSCCCFSSGSIPGGGGGGGGQVGGGGGGGGSAGTAGCSGNDKGAGGGGGGGSSFTGGVISGVSNPGIWLGNGQVSVSW